MKLSYNALHLVGNILFAARGGKIHSFCLNKSVPLSTWKHPDVDKVNEAVKAIAAQKAEAGQPAAESAGVIENEDHEEPPAKRRKRQDDDEVNDKAEEAGTTQTSSAQKAENASAGKKKGGKKSKDRQKSENQNKDRLISRVPDRPVISHLTGTADGKYLLAITSHDKTIWVFEHDGQGQLILLSQRVMPKRPSSVVISESDSQIIYADKFGDVYSLPLLWDPSTTPAAAQTSTSVPSEKPMYKPSADTTTVHSKRNLQALENQTRQMKLAGQGDNSQGAKQEGPPFKLNFLLGHVSMLNAVTLGESEGRRYIITGDRDEHIRISRYMPQTHVIVGFCLGHKEFVSSLLVPPSRSNILISGGGDNELFIWDWKNRRLLSKEDLLSPVRKFVPEQTTVAVTQLRSVTHQIQSGQHTFILAICEKVPVVFCWTLSPENTLENLSTIALDGNPLDICTFQMANGEFKLVITVQPFATEPEAKNIYIAALDLIEPGSDGPSPGQKWHFLQDTTFEAEEPDVPEEELDALLYTTELLRKVKEAPKAQESKDGEEPYEEEKVPVVRA